MIKRLMPHICIIAVLVTLTLLILSGFNPGIYMMDFYAVCMYVCCAAALIVSGILIYQNRKR